MTAARCQCGHNEGAHVPRGRGLPPYCSQCKGGKAQHSFGPSTVHEAMVTSPPINTEATMPQQEVAPMTATKTTEAPKRQPRANYTAGMRLVGRTGGKEYEGETFEGTNGRLGIQVGETMYDSLSAAAKAITGYGVSGNMFWQPPKDAKPAGIAALKVGAVLESRDGKYRGSVIEDADGRGFRVDTAADPALIGNVYDSPEAFATEVAGDKAATFWPAAKASAARTPRAAAKPKAVRAPKAAPKRPTAKRAPAKRTAAPKAAAKPRAKKATAA